MTGVRLSSELAAYADAARSVRGVTIGKELRVGNAVLTKPVPDYSKRGGKLWAEWFKTFRL